MSYITHQIARNAGFADYAIVGCYATLCAQKRTKSDNF